MSEPERRSDDFYANFLKPTTTDPQKEDNNENNQDKNNIGPQNTSTSIPNAVTFNKPTKFVKSATVQIDSSLDEEEYDQEHSYTSLNQRQQTYNNTNNYEEIEIPNIYKTSAATGLYKQFADSGIAITAPITQEGNQGVRGLGSTPLVKGIPPHGFSEEEIDQLIAHKFPHEQSVKWISCMSEDSAFGLIDRETLKDKLEPIFSNGKEYKQLTEEDKRILDKEYKIGNNWERGNELCTIEKIRELESKKNAIENVTRSTFTEARHRANPHEDIKGASFQNRAAVKMANLDKLANLSKPGQSLEFCDVCAGPGGFTEFLLWKKNGTNERRVSGDHARGLGFTLAGDCDWRFDKYSDEARLVLREPHRTQRQCEATLHKPWNFAVHYGVTGNGDILVNDNITSFKDFVMNTNGRLVELFVADGGISSAADENNQELNHHQLILCQFLMMHNVLKEGGDFVCKIFDTFNPFTVGLLYLIYLQFEQFTIVKPYTSRPLNSERYVIAKGRHSKEYTDLFTQYLFYINQVFTRLEKENEPLPQHQKKYITEIVDINDQVFKDFLNQTTLDICNRQIESFRHLFLCFDKPDIHIGQKEAAVEACLREWGIDGVPENTNKHKFNNKRGGGPYQRGGGYNRGNYRNNNNNYNNDHNNNNYNNNNNYHYNNNNNFNNYNNNNNSNNYRRNQNNDNNDQVNKFMDMYNQQENQQPRYTNSIQSNENPFPRSSIPSQPMGKVQKPPSRQKRPSNQGVMPSTNITNTSLPTPNPTNDSLKRKTTDDNELNDQHNVLLKKQTVERR